MKKEIFNLQQLFNSEIPISKELGVTVQSLTEKEIQLELPLEPNRNHKGTSFGGSLYSGCALACYGIFLSQLRSLGIQTMDIVISKGEIKYLAPVKADAQIVAGFRTLEEKAAFFRGLQAKGKARATMHAQVRVAGVLCAEFFGDFVAKI